MEHWDEIFNNKKSQGENINDNEFKITDAKRLQKLLNVSYFKKPFPYRTGSGQNAQNKSINLPAIRFPHWHYCSRCKVMQFLDINFQGDELVCSICPSTLKPYQKRLIPVRFVAVCSQGHIQDVPFDEWVHNGESTNHKLRFESGFGSGDLSSIGIRCLETNCNAGYKSLAGLMNIRTNEEDINHVYDSALARLGLEDRNQTFSITNPNTNTNGQFCKGHRPWLGSVGVEEPDHCMNHLRVLISGGSNVHYAKTKSSIFIPDIALKLSIYVNNLLTTERSSNLRAILDIDMPPDSRDALLKAQIKNYSETQNNAYHFDDLFEEIKNQLTDSEEEDSIEIKEVDLRFDEYNYFLSGNDDYDGDLVFETKDLDLYDESDFFKEHFDSIVLIKKLKETRAFYGFSRVNSTDGKTIRQSIAELSSTGEADWLPAIQVNGEGIFIKFSDKKIKEWLKNNHNISNRMQNAYHQSQARRNQSYLEHPKQINPVFILLHTFAHLLIKRLCFNCGYGSSALREKIYFSSDLDTTMNGILIYTSSGDSEGSLGGLVRQGNEQNLYPIINEALIDAEWCSADPVCSDIGKTGQGPDNINGAACHNCAILPETSCEEFNGLLDRTVVVGSIENKELGYFNRIS